MKKILPVLLAIGNKRKAKRNTLFSLFVFLSLISYLLYLIFSPVFMQAEGPVGVVRTGSVSASVGEYYLSVSGYASPFASIVMTSEGIFLRATVADANGNFYITGVLVKEGLANFCLETVDFKRLGTSVVCFSPSVTSNITMEKLFLPPTLGFANARIPAGSNAVALGYTMPGAKVTLYLSNGTKIEGFADNTGYYSFVIKDVKVGRYEVYAKAEYQEKESLTPTKTVTLTALSWWEQLLLFLQNLWKKLVKLITSISFSPLWLVLPIIILIIILLLKLWPEKFTAVYKSKLFAVVPFKRREKLLHHAWFMGY